MRYHHGWHRYIQTFPLKKHALLFKSEYVLREFLLLLCTEKYIFFKNLSLNQPLFKYKNSLEKRPDSDLTEV